ncbi:hypothetical protein DMC14_001455 [Metamycoplasma phocicerebrale]|uniref:Schlafen AlbA-2 domain-containing protein n=1 Tax=Metamycoplasma phocicerebrale TaxID=142649 RepID=A0A3T0TTV6_9BACT|nr:ATP-binding protein [Metamycoplasma phocicerebrale]AZZ65453.1 hypothetical protein DMC14_001455 [Metamycoplasma phocicerebrale]
MNKEQEEKIKKLIENLNNIGYLIKENTKKTEWHYLINFKNSKAVVNVHFDKKSNTKIVVNGEKAKYDIYLQTLVENFWNEKIDLEKNNLDIIELIDNKKELSFCDYKKEYFSSDNKNKTSDLLKDIISMANNLYKDDESKKRNNSYLIYGVDDEGNVCGLIEKDKKLLNQEYLNNLLKEKDFAGKKIPKVKVKTIYYKSIEILVLDIEKNIDAPYYLLKKYDQTYSYAIYTRHNSSNKEAEYEEVEELWKRHFN